MSSFESIRSQRIESLNIDAQEYRHGITGARHLHLSANDNNNAFIVGFQTLPRDSTGVAGQGKQQLARRCVLRNE